MKEMPLISCLCVSHNSTRQLQRAIKCFKAQTYPDKELIIVYESDNREIKELVKSISDKQIICKEVASQPKLPLGTLRNLSVSNSNGKYICQWDDDDWYSADRLQVQYQAVTQHCKVASMLIYWLMFDATNLNAYLSPFRLWEGSILCEKSAINDEINYASLEKGEDTILLGKLLETNCIFPIIKPSLYIYVFHGNNTWDFNHFNKFFSRGLKLPTHAAELIKDILDEKYTVEEGTMHLNDSNFLKDVMYRYELIDRYTLQLV
jgi:glycosyltransferase involved in cell wall biosynthesis